ncbi:MAG: hypothetical protein JKX92_06185 [Porticoccaceae bacterium]|nr:hypothetical protein [Porticoccaceae bacterium]
MTLNQLYKAINIALAVAPKERPAIMAAGGQSASNSALGGYWRASDDHRFRSIPPLALLGFCRGLVDQRPPDTPQHLAALQHIITSLERGERLGIELLHAFDGSEGEA